MNKERRKQIEAIKGRIESLPARPRPSHIVFVSLRMRWC